jgi:hypothetical protein
VNLGYEWFIVLDDDYISYRYLWNEDRVFQSTRKVCKKLDDLFEIYFEYFSKSFMKCLSFCQEGDLIGGPNSSFGKKINAKRKVMNIYFCNTHRKFEILGRMNDDVSTYVKHGNMGDLFITTNHCCLLQTPTQQNKGGLTEMYLEMGTFVKSFYSIMFQPSSVFCKTMGKYRRIHHMVDWKYTVPKILREEYKANG